MPKLIPFTFALAAFALPAAVASAQIFDKLFQGIQPLTPSAPAGVPSAPGAPREWSGEPGASGHPLMTVEAIRAAAADFPNCISRMWPDAAKRNISQQSFVAHTRGLTPDLRIMDLLDAQPEFTKAFWEYLDTLVTDSRIARGNEMLAQYRAAFDAAEKAYGVDRYTITAIWGVETNYGTIGGDRAVLRSTATLACVGRRQPYFKEEFLSRSKFSIAATCIPTA